MANDREQKIRDVYEAMHRSYRERLGAVDGVVSDMLHRCSRAAVDVLDPVTRIELSGGFYAEIPDNRTDFYRFYKDGKDHGLLRRDIVEAWAAAAEPRVTTTKTEVELKAAYAEIERLERERDKQDEEKERLRQRIASLGKIIEALEPADVSRLDSASYHAR